MNRHTVRAALVATIGATVAFVSSPAVADVTEATTMSFDMGFGKINSTITEQIAGDKRRTDTDAHCDGFLLSMLCGNMRGGEIVRLNKNVTWELDPKKKSYAETPFPTPEQIAAVNQKRAELLEKLKSCPQPAGRPAPDTSKCEMSPPQFEVQKTDETAMIAGHEARRSWIAMKQTCTNKETGDACEFDFRIDSWMTPDQIPEIKEARAFRIAYDRKLGVDEAAIAAAVGPQLQQFMAPYASALKQVGAKASDIQGTSLKTTLSVSVGGPHCGAAQDHRTQPTGGVTADAGSAATAAAENSTAAASGAAAEAAVTHATGGSLLGSISGSAAGAFGRTLVGGLFAKKSSAPQESKPTPPSGGGNMVPLISLTTETTEIRSGPIPSDQFDIPAGWALRQPKAQKTEEPFSCPKVGG